MSQAVKDMFQKTLNNYEEMKSVAQPYINKSECSIQESVYHNLPDQWLRKIFPGEVFTNGNV